MGDEKKKKKSVDGVTIGAVAVLGLLFVLGMDGKSLNFGSLTTSAPVNSSNPSTSIIVETPKQTQPVVTSVEVTVSGRDYLYENNRIGLETLITKLEQHGKDVEIRITTDETATINAMDALTSRLAEAGFTNYSKR